MPFKSKAQAKYMWVHDPKIAQEFSDKTKSIKALPEHVKNAIRGKEKNLKKGK